MSNIVSLKDFIEKNGKILGETIEKYLTPVWKQGEKIYEKEIINLLRKPFPVQKELIKGLAKAMYQENRKKLFICGEMGTGKTTISLSVVAYSPTPLRTLVVCPAHLVEKWIREAKLVIPDVTVVDLAVKEAISILQNLKEAKKPEKHEVWVISKERAKLSFSWRPVFITKKNKNLPCCPGCHEELIDKEKGKIYIENMLSTKKCLCPNCGESLWQAVPKPRRYSVAEYIKKYLKHKFDFLILDEIHDYKAGDTLQGNAMGMLVGCAKYFLGLTGTFSGGYASDIFYLLYRIAPHELKNYGYNGAETFQKQYGVIEEIRKLDNEESYKYGRGNKRSVIIKKRPGISPEVVGKYLLHRSCFIRLADVIDGLPPYDEYVVSLEMDGMQKAAYKKLEDQLREAVSRYRMKAVAPMLQSLLCYPDSCVVFPEEVKIKEKDSYGNKHIVDIINAPQLPVNLLPKERELFELCKKEKTEKRKVLVYIIYTGTRDIRQRIKSILEKQGFRVGILPETVEPKKREEWINKHKDFDILISNPELVKLGLDLYDYPTIVFFEVGYNIFTLRQAARRSWRIGQTQPVRVFYYCYKETMQEVALYLTARKVEQALLLEGDLPEGLAAELSDSGSIVEELARALVEGRSYTGAETAWTQMRKREIEANLGMNSEESILSVTNSGKKENIIKEKILASENLTVSVCVQQGKKKSVSRLTVKQSDIDSLRKKYGTLQFCLI
ncbi:DEAD/DEAH box helicase [Thermodesulfovibrio sp. 1176]|uniref:SNF2-related protein n=1 Tax=Thermodesulfovibrio sp. 1176 TaxID=3043424 RepID=UPI002482C32A|nr:DEAD/DEAH box helicase [Thermodesulfovibrio sp. 1176]MDI1472106.1 DEAD/DEAH box helicase [Thermodesulfovibrio sp. 1176]